MQLTQMEKDRDPFSRHILPPLPSRSERASAVLSFSWELAVITGVFLYPNLQRSRPDSSLLHAHGNISWRVARHQAAHKLINPTCLTTTCQALHQRRSGAAAKGQRVSNSRGAGAWTQRCGSKFRRETVGAGRREGGLRGASSTPSQPPTNWPRPCFEICALCR